MIYKMNDEEDHHTGKSVHLTSTVEHFLTLYYTTLGFDMGLINPLTLYPYFASSPESYIRSELVRSGKSDLRAANP